jgi:RHH-type transcriptional regulator, proline utilization regulon repressor / proline dehydrogenase / delta 1-pyrroline-5-carboxylate dehydrogenase
VTGLAPFANERVLELRRAPQRDALLAAARELDAQLPLRVPVSIGGERRDGEQLRSLDPGRPERVVAVAAVAAAADVDAAVEVARLGATRWAPLAAAERARALLSAAAILRERRLELAALAVRECAKPWPDADADVCEAIDFLEYYARGAIELERGRALDEPPGERNTMRYVARGVVGVIAPWNFPLAIPTGMVAAGLAVGNAVILKPAEQSPACAAAVVDALHRGGVPREALALLPGAEEPGRALVRHPGVHVLAFTGSCAVGLEIVREAARTPPGQDHVKSVAAEMGGKNCVIVDGDADLDEAVPAIMRSAFGYAGQKCSAASRVLAHESVLEPLRRRLAGAVRALRVAQAEELGVDVPPLIDADARARVLGYIALAGGGDGAGGEVLAQADPPPGGGWFAPPTLLAGLPADSPVLHEEIFGPVLSVEGVASVEQACERVEQLRFGLTGGLFSRNPAVVRDLAARTPVGNLYVNREITGAMVGRQPFGGNRLSGTGSKAGGPDYLLQFVESRVVCENTTRHGVVV